MKYIVSLFVLITLWSCDKSVVENVLEPYTPAKVDEAAGNWKTFILTSPTEISVPALNSDAAYKKEVDSVKALEITADQKVAVQYWGAGAVLRWNEIARELKYETQKFTRNYFNLCIGRAYTGAIIKFFWTRRK